MTEDIEQLVRDAKAGVDGSEQELFEYLSVRFRLFATYRVDAESAEDLAQDAVMIVLRKYKTVEFNPSFNAWARGVFRNVLRNEGRKRSRQTRVFTASDDSPGSEGSIPAPDHELRLSILKCLEKLLDGFPRYAQILEMKYRGGKTEEICGELQITPNNLFVRLTRARNKLNECLETGSL